MHKLILLAGLVFYFDFAIGQTSKYESNLQLFPESRTLSAGSTITYATRQPVDSLKFRLHKMMRINSLKIKQDPDFKSEVDSSSQQYIYTVRFSKQQKNEVKIFIEYEGGAEEAFQFYLHEEGCFLGGYGTAWYPQFLKYEGDNSNSIIPGTGVFNIRAPKGYTPAFSGAQLLRKDTGTNTWSFEVEKPTQISFTCARYFIVNDNGSPAITVYALKERLNNSETVKGCRKIISALENAFGKYPFSGFSIIEIPEGPAIRQGIGGASYQGGIWMSASALDVKMNVALFGHEIGHQWWGNLVASTGNEGRGMMDEALAQYGSLLAVTYMDGKQKAEQYRRTGYPGYIMNQCGLGYLKIAAAGKDMPLASLTSDRSHGLGDSKGFLIYNLLAETIGRDKFHYALKTITTRYGFATISWKVFLKEIEQASNQNLDWFFKQWFDQAGAPEWDVNYSLNGQRVTGTISQIGVPYQLNMEVLLRGYNDSIAYQNIPVKAVTQNFVLQEKFNIKEVLFNPHFTIPHWDSGYKRLVYALLPVTQLQQKRYAAQYSEADSLYQVYYSRLAQPDTYGVEFFLHYEKARVDMLRKEYKSAIQFFILALHAPVRNKELLPYLYEHLATCARAIADNALSEKALLWKKALQTE